jgi:hypothetical protein
MKLILFFTLLLNSALAQKTDVRIITWWGYLNKNNIIKIEKECKANISYDEYYSNTEFLRRYTKDSQKYDILIYSNAVYDFIEPGLTPIGSKLFKSTASDYNPAIMDKYNERKYKNTLFFLHSLTGFLWNPKNIDLTTNLTVPEIFKKAEGKIVGMIDDPVEFFTLVKRNKKSENLALEFFQDISKKSTIVISNDIVNVLNKESFAFAYIWSGDAITHDKTLSMKFKVHPELSHITSDLITINKKSDASQCVFQKLSSKAFLSDLQTNTNYFSSFVKGSEGFDKIHRIYHEMIKNIRKYPWLDRVSSKKYYLWEKEWKKIKINSLE